MSINFLKPKPNQKQNCKIKINKIINWYIRIKQKLKDIKLEGNETKIESMGNWIDKKESVFLAVSDFAKLYNKGKLWNQNLNKGYVGKFMVEDRLST